MKLWNSAYIRVNKVNSLLLSKSTMHCIRVYMVFRDLSAIKAHYEPEMPLGMFQIKKKKKDHSQHRYWNILHQRDFRWCILQPHLGYRWGPWSPGRFNVLSKIMVQMKVRTRSRTEFNDLRVIPERRWGSIHSWSHSGSQTWVYARLPWGACET